MEELAASGVLNRQQTIGVKHFQDFQERMLREEVTEIEEKVRSHGSGGNGLTQFLAWQ